MTHFIITCHICSYCLFSFDLFPPSVVAAAPVAPPSAPPAATFLSETLNAPHGVAPHGVVPQGVAPQGVSVQSKPLSFVSAATTRLAATSLPPGGALASGHSTFSFKPLGGATSLGSGISNQKGQLTQPIFGSNNQFNQSNNQFNQSNNQFGSNNQSNNDTSSIKSDASLSTSHTPGGTTGAGTKTDLGFGGLSGQPAGVKSADLTSSVPVQPDGQSGWSDHHFVISLLQ